MTNISQTLKQTYYETLFNTFVNELAKQGIALSEDLSEPFLQVLENSLYTALDLTFATLDRNLTFNQKKQK